MIPKSTPKMTPNSTPKKKKTSDSTPCFTTCHYCMISESIMDNRMKIDKDKNKKPAIFLYGRLAIG